MRHYTRNFLFLGLLIASSLHADTGTKPDEAYDADLFNADKRVFFINADFLYWFVSEGAVDYAVKMNHRPWSATTEDTFAIGKYQNAVYDWAPGFRLAFGYFNAPHYWDIFVQYTFLRSSGTDTCHEPSSGKYLNGTWIQPDLGSGTPPAPLHNAKSHISLSYNVLDFLASRRFQTNPHLRMNLFGGPTSAFLYQDWKVNYTDVNNVHSKIRNKWDFEGIGLKIGARVDWYMGWDIYLTGLASTGVLSGWYQNTAYQKTSVSLVGADSSKPIRNTRFNDTRLAYTAQMLAGFGWQKRYESVRIGLLAAYELNIWTNLHQIYRSGFGAPTAAKETFINDSDLTLQGLTLSLNVDF